MTVTRQIAEQLAGGHYSCEDCWYSCPKSVDGSCNDSAGDACNCGYDDRVSSIESALLAAEQRGSVQGLREAADMAERRWRGQTDMTFIRDAASAIEQETP